MNRCSICDYSQRLGSLLANRPPGPDAVTYHVSLGGFYCDTCAQEVRSNVNQALLDSDVIDEVGVED